MSISSEVADPAPVTTTGPSAKGRRPSGFGAVVLRLHFYAGVLSRRS
jgi:hypothetical protein